MTSITQLTTVKHRACPKRQSRFRRESLPNPGEYFKSQGLKITGVGEWRTALCPFHNDTSPSLRVRIDTGSFRCMACAAKGSDVLAFHWFKYQLNYFDAPKARKIWTRITAWKAEEIHAFLAQLDRGDNA